MTQELKQKLEQKVIDTFKAFDALDLPTISATLSDDVETVDEITQKWNRGRAAAEANFEALVGVVTDIHSNVSEFNVLVAGEMAIVTCLLKQTYVYEGNPVSIVAPTTCALRNENGQWKFVLLHSVPFA